MAPKKKSPYKVGYGRPPLETRFIAGTSGNPAGRPKGALNVRTTLTRILSEKVVVIQNGKKKTVTKFEAAMTKLAHKAIEGDMRASSQVCGLMLAAEEHAKTEQPKSAGLGRAEMTLLRDLSERHTRMKGKTRHES